MDLEVQQTLLISQLKDLVRQKDTEVEEKIQALKVCSLVFVIGSLVSGGPVPEPISKSLKGPTGPPDTFSKSFF